MQSKTLFLITTTAYVGKTANCKQTNKQLNKQSNAYPTIILKKKIKCVIYVERHTKTNHLSNSKPCVDCLNLMKHMVKLNLKITKVYYSVIENNSRFIKVEKLNQINTAHISAAKRFKDSRARSVLRTSSLSHP